MASILYGASYQQFRHFDTSDPRGVDDSLSYLKMARGDYQVDGYHRYRFIIPSTVGLVSRVTNLTSEIGVRWIFYFVNFSLLILTALVFFHFLQALKFNGFLSIIGVAIFLTSRITVLAAATPLIDSIYFLNVMVVIFLILTNRFNLFFLFMPLTLISKETLLPFLFLVVFKEEFWANKKNIAKFIAALVCAFVVFILSRKFIQVDGEKAKGIGQLILALLPNIPEVLRAIMSPQGIFNIFNGMFLTYLLSLYAYFVNKMDHLPRFLKFYVFIPLVFMLIGGGVHMGRHLFIIFPVAISCALITIEHFFKAASSTPVRS